MKRDKSDDNVFQVTFETVQGATAGGNQKKHRMEVSVHGSLIILNHRSLLHTGIDSCITINEYTIHNSIVVIMAMGLWCHNTNTFLVWKLSPLIIFRLLKLGFLNCYHTRITHS